MIEKKTPKGWCYAPSGVLVGGTRQRHFDRTSLNPETCLTAQRACARREVAVLPLHLHDLLAQITCGASMASALFAGDRVHAVLGRLLLSLY